MCWSLLELGEAQTRPGGESGGCEALGHCQSSIVTVFPVIPKPTHPGLWDGTLGGPDKSSGPTLESASVLEDVLRQEAGPQLQSLGLSQAGQGS